MLTKAAVSWKLRVSAQTDQHLNFMLSLDHDLEKAAELYSCLHYETTYTNTTYNQGRVK